MFEERCIYCGGHLSDDSRAFCSDECRTQDAGLGSGNNSSSSSALSSPHLGYASGDPDVPALIPSTLGSALRGHHSRYSVSSSSASSTSWSGLTDDEDEDGRHSIGSDSIYNDSADPASFDGNAKSTTIPGRPTYLTPLSYARRPSGTNNGSSVSQRSSSGHVRSAPRSAPIHFRSHPSMDDDDSSDFGFSGRDEYEPGYPRTAPDEQHKSTIKKAKRSRNRASLPAYFSLLQVSSTGPLPDHPASSLSNSSGGQTISKPSPPTPKLSLAGLAAYPSTAPPSATLQSTPRGRKRDLAASRASRFAEHFSSSSSRSRSRSRSKPAVETTPSVPQMFDWSSEQPTFPRGRQAVRRNSSPPPKMILNMMAMEDFSSIPTHRKVDSTGSRPPQRGRMRVEELDGVGGCSQAPGYGNGRSGLLDREQRGGLRYGYR
ncbi:hypothetical protein Moror_14907 [Moniliophthora roreri MCA 2997]|uniref:Uncharacterized protein n=1 Tax=Moniliophthora roreri (strain MCA 2997) TaxID=1381753 RepID=V2WWI7_MONRO|nr:hypothetical protein Moror_14907 [Moniliophthora roreri MCA 2997]